MITMQNFIYSARASFYRLKRNTFISSVDRLQEVKILRQVEGYKAIGLNTKLCEETSICHNWHQKWNGDAIRISLAQDGAQCIEQAHIRFRKAWTVTRNFDFNLVAHNLT